MTSQFTDIASSSKLFDVVLFLLSNLVTSPSFMSISSLVLELWQFSFIRDWPEIRKSEIPTSEFCPLSEDWSKFGANVSNRMLLNAAKFQGYSFYRFWVIKGKPTEGGAGGGKITPTLIRVNRMLQLSSLGWLEIFIYFHMLVVFFHIWCSIWLSLPNFLYFSGLQYFQLNKLQVKPFLQVPSPNFALNIKHI